MQYVCRTFVVMKLSRVDFIKLTVRTRERFDARSRRKQFPWPVDISGTERFDPSFALLTIVQDELNTQLGMPLDDAATLAFNLRNWLFNRKESAALWAAIHGTARDFRAGKKPAEVLAGGLNGTRWPLAGTFEQIAQFICDQSGKGSRVSAIALVSITRAAATMMERAKEHEIDLKEFWDGTAAMVKEYQDAARRQNEAIRQQARRTGKNQVSRTSPILSASASIGFWLSFSSPCTNARAMFWCRRWARLGI
jgi:hypothetical protein